MANIQFPTASAQKIAGIWNSDHALVDEGSYFVALTPTAGTGVAMTTSVVDDAATASSTHAQAAPLLYIGNTDAKGGSASKTLYLKYLRLVQIISAQAWTSATNVQFSWRLDQTPRYTSGGTQLNPTNLNPASGSASPSVIYFGANICALPSGAGAMVSRGQIQGTIPLPGDQWIFTFGDVSAPTGTLGASAIKNITIPCPPLIVPPGCNLALDIWATTLAAAPAFEVELGFVARVSGQ
jgi:hypothetical protein